MAENENVSEVSKDVLAPHEGPRENLISTAVKFLQNPKVQNSPLTQRQLFLEKKGLTKEEIELAIERSGISTQQNDSTPQHSSQVLSQRNIHPSQQPVQYYPVSMTRWERVRSYTSTALILAGVAYAGYYIYKTYIRPLLYHTRDNDKRLTNLEAKIQEVQSETTESMKQIQESLKSIQFVITQQQIANSSQTTIKQHDLNSINEIKTEIQSLKGLLLNRRQFPPAPSTSPILPSWQLTPSNSNTSINNDNRNNDDKDDNTEVTMVNNDINTELVSKTSDNTELVTKTSDNTELVTKTSDNTETEQCDKVLTCDNKNTEVPEESVHNGVLQTSEA